MEKQILQIINSLELQVWLMAGKVALAIVVALIAKGRLESVASYYLFKSIRGLGEEVPLIINGQPGTISTITKRLIRIDLENGNELVIPITRWKYQTWIIRKGK